MCGGKPEDTKQEELSVFSNPPIDDWRDVPDEAAKAEAGKVDGKPTTLADVPRPESHKSPEHIRKVLDSVLEWSIRIEERMEKLEELVNKLREGGNGPVA